MKFNTHFTTPPHWILACILALSITFAFSSCSDGSSGSDDDDSGQITTPVENPSNPSNPGTSGGNGGSSTSKSSYTITFDLNGGEGTLPADISAKSGEEFTLPSAELTKTGYDFKGWCTTSDGKGTTYAAGSTAKDLTAENGATVTLYAKWVLQGNWSISYILNDDEANPAQNAESNPAEYNIESAVTLAEPERSFYEFAGWYGNADFSGDKVEGWNAGAKTGDITLYAKWNLTQTSISAAIEAGATEIKLSGKISEDTINMISEALKKNSSKKLAVDLSQTTGLTTIDWNAFKDCSNLTSVSIPGSVTSIDCVAFSGCTSLAELTVSEINENYKSYENCIYTKDGKTLIMAARALTNATLPDGVTCIEDFAFYDCRNLTSVTIPNSVTSIRDDAFRDCTSLTELTVSESNETYKSYENCIYTKDGKSLIMAAKALTSVTFLEGVTSIDFNAFRYCCKLTNVTIPDSVSYIDRNVFENCSLISVSIPNSITLIRVSTFFNCSSLTSVIIPDSVKTIEDSAFGYCNSLTTVNYKGNEEQWNAIKIEVNNDPLKNATVNYNYTGE